jgi:hypothetical protein
MNRETARQPAATARRLTPGAPPPQRRPCKTKSRRVVARFGGAAAGWCRRIEDPVVLLCRLKALDFTYRLWREGMCEYWVEPGRAKAAALGALRQVAPWWSWISVVPPRGFGRRPWSEQDWRSEIERHPAARLGAAYRRQALSRRVGGARACGVRQAEEGLQMPAALRGQGQGRKGARRRRGSRASHATFTFAFNGGNGEIWCELSARA